MNAKTSKAAKSGQTTLVIKMTGCIKALKAGEKLVNNLITAQALGAARALADDNAGLVGATAPTFKLFRKGAAKSIREAFPTNSLWRVRSYDVADAAIAMLKNPGKEYAALNGATGAASIGKKTIGLKPNKGAGKKAASKGASHETSKASQTASDTGDKTNLPEVKTLTARRLIPAIASMDAARDMAQQSDNDPKAWAALAQASETVSKEFALFLKHAAGHNVQIC